MFACQILNLVCLLVLTLLNKTSMDKRIYKTWEDIYPLTLINLRYGGYVAFNAEEDASFIQEVNTEEVSYELINWLEEHVSPCPYGVGDTVMDTVIDGVTVGVLVGDTVMDGVAVGVCVVIG
mgnify:CR=1 FL=1